MTLNGYEWLEWPLYVKFSLLRTAFQQLAYILTRLFGIRGKTSDLSYMLHRRNLNKYPVSYRLSPDSKTRDLE